MLRSSTDLLGLVGCLGEYLYGLRFGLMEDLMDLAFEIGERCLGESLRLDEFFGWYDLIVTVAGDAAFKYRLAGHVETGRDSFSDPALRGLVTLKG